MTWPIEPLERVAEVIIGRTPPRIEPKFWGVGHPWLSIADMGKSRSISATKESISDEGATLFRGRLAQPGTVLLSFKLSVGKVGIAAVPLYTNEAIAALPIRDTSRLLPEFLARYLEFADLTAGTDRAAMGNTLNLPKLKAIPIPLPPLPDQRRIAAILDQADELRAKRRGALALLEKLIDALFFESFGGAEYPMVAVDQLLADLPNAIRTGPFGSQLLHSEFVSSGVPVLGIDTAVSNEFVEGSRRFITPEKYELLKRYTVRPRDVLITIMGTIGRCAVVPDDIQISINTKHLCCITLDQSLCIPEYLQQYFLKDARAAQYLSSVSKGAIMDGLNMGLIRSMPVALPPIALQRKFVDRYRAITEERSKARTHLANLDELFASLQYRAFEGAS